jgi:cytochrome c peroxidase
VAAWIGRRYRSDYEAVFGPLPLAARPGVPSPRGQSSSGVNRVFANVGKALEAYQRRLAPGVAAFDRFVAALRKGESGEEFLSPSARRGLRLFIGEARCVTCHNGPLFSDNAFHNLGLPPAAGDAQPEGRKLGASLSKQDAFRCGGKFSDAPPDVCDESRFLDPSSVEWMGAFRTPSLRNVAETAPYMHGGQFRTLSEVIAFYRSRPGQPAVGHRDPLLRRIPRSLPAADLIAFLQSLTGALPPETWRVPATISD